MRNTDLQTPTPKKRYLSVDMVRGFAMAFVVGGVTLVKDFADLLPWDDLSDFIITQWTHAPWDGIRLGETFTLLLFISGMSVALHGKSTGKLEKITAKKLLYRTLQLILLGMVYNGLFNFDFANLRYCSVLFRIGGAVALASIIFYKTTTQRARILWVSGILTVYGVLSLVLVAPDAAGASPLTMEGNFGCWLDRTLLGAHCSAPRYAPEGIVGTRVATSTALIGAIVGGFITDERYNDNKRIFVLIGTGFAMCIAAYLLCDIIPVNKKLWSSTYVLMLTGVSMVIFAAFYCIVEKWRFTFGLKWLISLGRNSIAAYFVHRIFDFTAASKFFLSGLCRYLPDYMTTPLIDIGAFVLLVGLFCFLDKKKIYIKV